jgi:predicted nucleic acid-binding Zn ribbon protein
MKRVYDFKCNACGDMKEYVLEPEQKITQIRHVGCDGFYKRVYTFGGFTLKGHGFYRTDKL